jgi:hypothetical protein
MSGLYDFRFEWLCLRCKWSLGNIAHYIYAFYMHYLVKAVFNAFSQVISRNQTLCKTAGGTFS